jgi:large subunit ribosomal protein L9
MKVLLLKDVYKLGRAGDVKKVADGYGRNYLIPQGLATLATSGAMKMADRIRDQAAERRAVLNKELSGVSDQLTKLMLAFPAKAGDTGKLYGSITPQMIVDAVKDKTGYEIDRRQLDTQPLRTLGEHHVHVRLTIDLIPDIKVIVHREGETPEETMAEIAEEAERQAADDAAAEAAEEASVREEAAAEEAPAEEDAAAEPVAEAETPESSE